MFASLSGPTSWNAIKHPTTYPMRRIPFTVPRRPGGDTSDRYTGTICVDAPTPAPVMNRPSIIVQSDPPRRRRGCRAPTGSSWRRARRVGPPYPRTGRCRAPREPSDDHDGDDGSFGKVIAAEAQVFRDVREWGVDDRGVVAEEEGAEARGDDGRDEARADVVPVVPDVHVILALALVVALVVAADREFWWVLRIGTSGGILAVARGRGRPVALDHRVDPDDASAMKRQTFFRPRRDERGKRDATIAAWTRERRCDRGIPRVERVTRRWGCGASRRQPRALTRRTLAPRRSGSRIRSGAATAPRHAIVALIAIRAHTAARPQPLQDIAHGTLSLGTSASDSSA